MPSLQKWLKDFHPNISLQYDTLGDGGAYTHSILIFEDVITALLSVEDAPTIYSTDFSHQYVQYGGYGNIWGLVTCDPDGYNFNSIFD